MTMPDERHRAVVETERFLRELCDPKATPKVPSIIRSQARSLLRHYPSRLDMERACEAIPEVFQTRMEAVSKLLARYEETHPDKRTTLTLPKTGK